MCLLVVVAETFRGSPGHRLTFLAHCGSTLHAAAVRVLFKEITLQDDARSLTPSLSRYLPRQGPIAALLLNPARYSAAVHSITVEDPSSFLPIVESPALFRFDEQAGSSSDEESAPGLTERNLQPLPTTELERILKLCQNLRDFTWKATVLPPDSLCEVRDCAHPKFNGGSHLLS